MRSRLTWVIAGAAVGRQAELGEAVLISASLNVAAAIDALHPRARYGGLIMHLDRGAGPAYALRLLVDTFVQPL